MPDDLGWRLIRQAWNHGESDPWLAYMSTDGENEAIDVKELDGCESYLRWYHRSSAEQYAYALSSHVHMVIITHAWCATWPEESAAVGRRLQCQIFLQIL